MLLAKADCKSKLQLHYTIYHRPYTTILNVWLIFDCILVSAVQWGDNEFEHRYSDHTELPEGCSIRCVSANSCSRAWSQSRLPGKQRDKTISVTAWRSGIVIFCSIFIGLRCSKLHVEAENMNSSRIQTMMWSIHPLNLSKMLLISLFEMKRLCIKMLYHSGWQLHNN